MGSKHPRGGTSAPPQGEEQQAQVDTEQPTESPAFSRAAPGAVEMQVTLTPTTLPTLVEPVPMEVSGEELSNLAVPPQHNLWRKSFTMVEVQQLISINPNRTLVIIRDKVYDVTTFLASHPGGKSVLRRNNGKDVTDAFFSMHSATAVRRLPAFLIGELVPPESTSAADDETTTAAIIPARLRMTDIRKALSEDSNRIILILFNDAYDVTPMRNRHPGGLHVLTNNNGLECGDIFMRIHGLLAKKMVQQFFLGHVEGLAQRMSPLRPAVAVAAESASIHPSGHKAQSTRILAIEPVNSTATIQYFTFSCTQPLQIIPGGHIKLYSDLHKEESRFYTPFKTDATSFTICMKHYPNGRTSGFFFGRKEGDEVFFDGPLPPSWQLNTDAAVQRSAPQERHIVLIAGGTGIVPLYSIASNALETQLSSVTLVCSVRTPDDLILATELRRLANRYAKALPTQRHTLRIVLLFSRASLQDVSVESTSFASHVLCGGRLTADSFKGIQIPAAQATIVCGPPAFHDAVSAALLKAGICTAAQVRQL
ncbi:nitrate reductase, putative [Leishmania tarentolae]|uniref:Acyl-lipid (7-3)-desaturase n=1 Tax=Leishmania tarentolae TaxID=5689 RepID=A0A640KLQ0_LEITA|nr:nitrate reductase, putative [Leishmania tarentolae]